MVLYVLIIFFFYPCGHQCAHWPGWSSSVHDSGGATFISYENNFTAPQMAGMIGVSLTEYGLLIRPYQVNVSILTVHNNHNYNYTTSVIM